MTVKSVAVKFTVVIPSRVPRLYPWGVRRKGRTLSSGQEVGPLAWLFNMCRPFVHRKVRSLFRCELAEHSSVL